MVRLLTPHIKNDLTLLECSNMTQLNLPIKVFHLALEDEWSLPLNRYFAIKK